MDLPQLGTVAVLLQKSGKSVACPETPSVTLCPQCKAAVPVRRKTCERCDLVFRFKRKAECNLREKTV